MAELSLESCTVCHSLNSGVSDNISFSDVDIAATSGCATCNILQEGVNKCLRLTEEISTLQMISGTVYFSPKGVLDFFIDAGKDLKHFPYFAISIILTKYLRRCSISMVEHSRSTKDLRKLSIR
jgi:hypothetical protein